MVPQNMSRLFVLAALLGTALSHGLVTSYKTDGETHQGFILDYYYAKINKQPVPDTAGWYTENVDSGFVAPDSYSTPDIICHKNATPGTLSTPIAAGGQVDFQWNTWPHPHGPILTYVAKCPDSCTTVDKTTLKWVKIQEDGLNFDTQEWASAVLIKQNFLWSTTIPKSLVKGNYVVRHEVIALHGAGSLNGAQNYPQCINIEITGSGTADPPGVLGTELYTNKDAGILVNPFNPKLTNYTMPGPALFTG